ncbi:hypothetical protein AWJ14_07920 [Hoeflea olei]|uniref:DNA 3'-5' helicase n=2 Tax=Hoeflea olei TaxID=1480615 RepID=A0A1C1YU72_9HYPH|nr:ATP-dependent helicase [Hoeflea olei]OCW57069.1 hypothetical protein AWJ14_07920 [Hoeflea olei]
MTDLANAPLDEVQKRFVLAPDEDIRLLAPAGSGKTHSLLYRCLELFDRSGGEARFLVVTFTRAARDELRARLGGGSFARIAPACDVVTLNGYGWRQVRSAFTNSRLAASEFDRQNLIRGPLSGAWSEIEPLRATMESQPVNLPRVLANLLDTMKTLGFDHETGTLRHANDRLDALEELGLIDLLNEPKEKLLEFGALENGRWESFLDVTLPFFANACKQQQSQAAFTLEDQKYFGWLALRRRLKDGNLPAGNEAITHILVDEFQDINPLDLSLVLTIADLNRSKLTLVGDDDQAIFEWRGAAPDFILYPREHLKRPFTTHILTRNYRCPRNIVEKSARLIAFNTRREKKEMIAVATTEAAIDRLNGDTFLDTTRRITGEIKAFVAAQQPGARMALLSRKRAQLIPYQILLARDEIPFCAAEDLHVFLSDTFDRLLSALRIRHIASQMPALAQMGIRLPTIVDDIMALCNSVQRFPLRKAEADALSSHLRRGQPATYDAALEALEAYAGPIRGKQDDGKTVKDFAIRLRKFLHSPDVHSSIEALQTLYRGFQQDYGRSQEDIFLADPPFFYLAAFAETYGSDYQKFIDDLDKAKATLVRLPGMDGDDDGTSSSHWRKPVHLMTALRAKGREFHTVVMLDVVDGIWPLRRAKTARQIEGERRLFYVAMTRAKSRLMLTTSGRIGEEVTAPSPFLAEADL